MITFFFKRSQVVQLVGTFKAGLCTRINHPGFGCWRPSGVLTPRYKTKTYIHVFITVIIRVDVGV